MADRIGYESRGPQHIVNAVGPTSSAQSYTPDYPPPPRSPALHDNGRPISRPGYFNGTSNSSTDYVVQGSNSYGSKQETPYPNSQQFNQSPPIDLSSGLSRMHLSNQGGPSPTYSQPPPLPPRPPSNESTYLLRKHSSPVYELPGDLVQQPSQSPSQSLSSEHLSFPGSGTLYELPADVPQQSSQPTSRPFQPQYQQRPQSMSPNESRPVLELPGSVVHDPSPLQLGYPHSTHSPSDLPDKHSSSGGDFPPPPPPRPLSQNYGQISHPNSTPSYDPANYVASQPSLSPSQLAPPQQSPHFQSGDPHSIRRHSSSSNLSLPVSHPQSGRRYSASNLSPPLSYFPPPPPPPPPPRPQSNVNGQFQQISPPPPYDPSEYVLQQPSPSNLIPSHSPSHNQLNSNQPSPYHPSPSPSLSPSLSYFPPPPTSGSSQYGTSPQPSISHPTNTSGQLPSPSPHTTPLPTPSPVEVQDDHKSSTGRRFFGNTLGGRVVRASYKSLTTTIGLPLYLSPWGDNTPVTLPNVRRRDAALAFVGHIGAEALAPAVLDVTSEFIKTGVQQSAEQVADESLTRIFGGKGGKITHVGVLRTLEIRIKHKLMGVDAVIQLHGERTAASMLDYSKGWFCPYLFASGRTPRISRAKDFSVAELLTPGLRADPELARTLLTIIEQDPTASLLSLCDWNPTVNINTNPTSSRLLVLFLGITPWRTQLWSQARIPGEARLMLHLLQGCPALVIPTSAQGQEQLGVCAWSPWTLRQMCQSANYSVDGHVAELARYLDGVLNVEALSSSTTTSQENARRNSTAWITAALRNIVVHAREARSKVYANSLSAKILDENHAGIVMFRY